MAESICAVIFDMDGVLTDSEPIRCVVIEDAVNGVEAAKAARMRCVAVAQTFPADRLATADLVRPGMTQITVADLQGGG